MIPNRLKRVNTLIQHDLSEIIRLEIKDPRVGFVTVTGVETAADLRVSQVYVSVMDAEENQEKALTALNKAASFIRLKLRDNLTLRTIPTLVFHLDHSIERGVHISRLIDELSEEEKKLRAENEQKEKEDKEKKLKVKLEKKRKDIERKTPKEKRT